MTTTNVARYIVVLLGFSFCPGLTLSQEAPPLLTTVPLGCGALIRELQQTPPGLRAQEVARETDMVNHPECLVQLLIPASAAETHATISALAKISKQSSTKQAGSTSGTPGTTSAVSQPVGLLSLASEYGGLTTSTNNGTFTLQAALDQVPSALAKDHLIEFCTPATKRPECLKGSTLEFLHRFSIATTFNTSTSSKTVNAMATSTSQSTTQAVSLTPHGNESPSFSSLVAKFVILKDKADTSDPWVKAVSNATDVTKLARALGAAIAALPQGLDTNFYYLKWQACTRSALAQAQNGQFEAVFLQYYVKLNGILMGGEPFTCPQNDQQIEENIETKLNIPKPTGRQPVPGLQDALLKFKGAFEDYSLAVNTLRLSTENPVVALEYDWNRPQSQPTNSVFKVIFSKNLLDSTKKNNLWTFTGNFAASIYNSEPASTIPGASHLRDIQAGAEADRMLPSIPLLGQTTLSVAYYFQEQTSPSILNVTPGTPITGITFTGLPSNASQVFTQKGNIHLAQLKWALGTGKNVRFPFALSYSNRTELIQKPDWRGQFGVSYDFSSLLSSQSSANK
jgi:hypothetical protein